jgi:predicted nucleic acid-binding protein
MIAVDTNVVSELMRVEPDPAVLEWSAAQDDAALAVPAVVVAELLRGLGRLPAGSRRRRLEGALDAFFGRLGDHRVLGLGAVGAVAYAQIMTTRDRAGLPMRTMDALIAATCREHSASLATRNTKDFAGAGLRLVDPWSRG